MVGHSGKIEPTIKGVETVDACLGQLYQALKQHGGSMLVTADHGNAELMVDPVSGGPHTSHTTNPVPFVLITDAGKKVGIAEHGSLRDISPTILDLLNLEHPRDMTGKSLIRRNL
jgi:2,3-bisphosphoglycerate-independent phosphoglycerate mutase